MLRSNFFPARLGVPLFEKRPTSRREICLKMAKKYDKIKRGADPEEVHNFADTCAYLTGGGIWALGWDPI
jgi:hypothetical protein